MDLASPGLGETIEQLLDEPDPARLREVILDLVGAYARLAHAPKPFEPGISAVPVSGKVYDETDMRSLADSALIPGSNGFGACARRA